MRNRPPPSGTYQRQTVPVFVLRMRVPLATSMTSASSMASPDVSSYRPSRRKRYGPKPTAEKTVAVIGAAGASESPMKDIDGKASLVKSDDAAELSTTYEPLTGA